MKTIHSSNQGGKKKRKMSVDLLRSKIFQKKIESQATEIDTSTNVKAEENKLSPKKKKHKKFFDDGKSTKGYVESGNGDLHPKKKKLKGTKDSDTDNSVVPSAILRTDELSLKNQFLFKDVIPINPKGRLYTVGIAIPMSILSETCLNDQLKTYVIGQIARATCTYSVDEIIIYDDGCCKDDSEDSGEIMSMILQYMECPQYLRKWLFPTHPYLSYAGSLNALNSTHHLLANQWCSYREGVILNKGNLDHKFRHAYVGLKNPIQVKHKVDPGTRVTIYFPPEVAIIDANSGYVVSSDEPRTKAGLYWGYKVRKAKSLSEVFKNDKFAGGYDLIIGTSDKGQDSNKATFNKFSHALIVFGGVNGLEAAMEADEAITTTCITDIFPNYLNVCPNQSTRTIRTEEAVPIALAVLSPKLTASGRK